MADKINPEKLEDLKAKAQEAFSDPEKLKANILEPSASFYDRNKPAVQLAALVLAYYLVEKRMVKKVVRKELNRSMTQLGFAVELVSNPDFTAKAGETAGILIAQVQEAGKTLFAK